MSGVTVLAYMYRRPPRYGTLQDEENLYLLLEPALGGLLRTHLRLAQGQRFPVATAKVGTLVHAGKLAPKT